MDEKDVSPVRESRLLRNTVLLYAAHGFRLLIPLLILPALTRRLSPSAYGMVVYTQSLMTNFQTFVDFGFNTSTVAEISRARGDPARVGRLAAGTVAAKGRLALAAGAGLLLYAVWEGTGGARALYLLLSGAAVALSVFLPDFLFCGLEKMEVNTLIFLVMKAGAGALTLAFVRSDAQVWLIPAFDILLTLAGIGLYRGAVRRLGLRISGRGESWRPLVRESVWYFAADFLPSLNGTLSTLLLWKCLDAEEYACWCLSWQIFSALRGLYQPLRTALFPHMARDRTGGIFRRLAVLLLPLAALGCLACWWGAEFAVTLLGGKEYLAAAGMLRRLIPVLFLGCPSMMAGWLALGAAGKKRTLFFSCAAGTAVQILGFTVLAATRVLTAASAPWVLLLSEGVILLAQLICLERGVQE